MNKKFAFVLCVIMAVALLWVEDEKESLALLISNLWMMTAIIVATKGD